MADIMIPNVDAELERRLKERAARHGRSPEAEARAILEGALGAGTGVVPGNLAEAIRAIVEPIGGVELEPFPRKPVPDPPSFE